MSYESGFDEDLNSDESLNIEFKREFPEEEARKLAKVVASFASTAGGRIYLGVANDGTVVGLDLRTQLDRDKFQRRILGVCAGIEPRIRVFVHFIERDGKKICVVNVPKGTEPVYFVASIPYLRDLNESRRATPNEVKEMHWSFFLDSGLIEREDEEGSFAIRTLYQLSDVALIASDFRDHMIEPDLGQMLYELDATGATLLELSNDAIAKNLGAKLELREIAEALSKLPRLRLASKSALVDKFASRLLEIAQATRRLENRLLKRIDDIDLEDVRGFIHRDLRELEREWNNAGRYLQRGEFERLWDTFRRLAFSFYRLGRLPEPAHVGGLMLNLRELGEKLRALTSYQRYFVLGGNTNPITRLEKPIEEVLLIAKEIESLIA